MNSAVTLTRHILEGQKAHPGATGEFSALLTQVALAGKRISFELSRAGLLGETGLTGKTNVHGEAVKELDQIANDIFVDSFEYLDLVSMVVSEEMDTAATLKGKSKTGKYSLYIDPMDGSSNIEINETLGSIFSIHRNLNGETKTEKDLLFKGSQQITAGYLMYGPSTMLVIAYGSEVHGFTLDTGLGEFILTHPHIRIPSQGKIISWNPGNAAKWDAGLQKYLRHTQTQTEKEKLFTYRYAGTFVSDFHRILLKGGVFLYPGEVKKPEGKLRLLYEVAPLGFVCEKAGGKASTGKEPILNIQPTDIHQHIPIVIGSPQNVDEILSYLK